MFLHKEMCCKFFKFEENILNNIYNKNEFSVSSIKLYDICNKDNLIKIEQSILDNDKIVYGLLRFDQTLIEKNTPKKNKLRTEDINEDVFVNGRYYFDSSQGIKRKWVFIKALNIIDVW